MNNNVRSRINSGGEMARFGSAMATLAVLENAEIDREFPPSGDQAIRRNPDAPENPGPAPPVSAK